MSLPQQAFKHIADAGNAMMECGDKPTFQDIALHKLHDVIGSESSVYYDISGDIDNLQFKDGHSLGVPKEAPRLWCEHYRDSDPFVNRAMDDIVEGNQTTIISKDVVKPREYTNTEFYCDFLNPQHVHHVMVIPIVEDARPIALIGLHRPANLTSFSDEDILKAEVIKPYLKAGLQKLRLNTHLEECKSTIAELATDLPFEGIIVLDNDLIPIVINDDTYRLFDELEGRRGVDDKVISCLPNEIYACCKQWQAIYPVRPASELPDRIEFKVDREQRSLNGYVRAAETDAGDIFFIICLGEGNQGLINARNLERFNLTRREIDIVHLVSTGMTNPEMARKLFISARTVQNHLRSIYAKVGVHNRTSLISALARD